MRKRSIVVDTLRERVVSARRFGTLDVDGRLPSARTLATELEVDPRVVVAAYRGLEREGLVEQRPPSRAFFVAGHASGAAKRGGRQAPAPPDAGTPVLASEPRAADGADPHPVEWLAGVLAQAVERDIPVPAFPERAWRATDTLRLRAVCVECNRDQITWLCRELHEDYGIDAEGLEVDALPPDAPDRSSRGVRPRLPLALRRADLLVTTAEHAPVVEALAERLGCPCVVVAQREDLVRELARLLAAGPVYFVGTDPRFGTKLRATYAGRCDPGHVRPVILGHVAPPPVATATTAAAMTVAAIPAGAPTYVMRTARDRLGGVPPHVRVLPTLRAFSRETRLAVLRLVVAHNLAAWAAQPARAGGGSHDHT